MAIPKIDVEIVPLDDEENGGVYIRCHGEEIVSWTSDEFKETDGMWATFACIHALDYGHKHGADALADSVGKFWNGGEWMITDHFFEHYYPNSKNKRYWIDHRTEFFTIDIALHLGEDNDGYFLFYSGENQSLIARHDFDVLDINTLKEIAEWYWLEFKTEEHEFKDEEDVLDALVRMYSPVEM